MLDVYDILYNELEHFIEFIREKKGWDLSLENYVRTIQTKSESRCAGRVWDAKNWDINKQCKNIVVQLLMNSIFSIKSY